MTKKPVIFGGIALLFGYCTAAFQRLERPVSSELIRFHRREQMAKLRLILGALARFRKMNKFWIGVTPEAQSFVK